MTEPIDGLTALERAYDDLAKVVANLDAGQLARPTCCPDWDVRGLLNHILGGAVMYTRVNDGETAGEDQAKRTNKQESCHHAGPKTVTVRGLMS